MPNAQISVVDASSGTAYSSTTRSTGRFDISNVRTGGPYRVKATANGQSRTKSGVFTTLSQTAEVDLQLPAAGATPEPAAPAPAGEEGANTTERVVVQGSAVDDIYSSDRTGTSTYVNREQINNLPTISRSLND